MSGFAPPIRPRNSSIPSAESPSATALSNALFANAHKALTQNQPKLLEMFLNKHPSLSLERHTVTRPGQAGEGRRGPDGRVEEVLVPPVPPKTVQLLLIEAAVEMNGEDMASIVVKVMATEGARRASTGDPNHPNPFSLLAALSADYEAGKTALQMMARNDMVDLLKEIEALAGAEEGEEGEEEGGAKEAREAQEAQEANKKVQKLKLASIKDSDGATLLFAAAATGALRVISYLLDDLSADVNATQSAGATPLHLAATSAGAGPKTMALLLQAGCKIDVQDKALLTPFFLACKVGNLAALTALHEAGADMDISPENGAEPIYVACQLNHLAVVKKLVMWGANVDSSGSGTFPIHISAMMGHTELVEFLLTSSADPNSKGGEQESTALGICAQQGNSDTAMVLIAHGADVNQPGVTGATPLHFACWFGKAEMAKTLLEAGADVNLEDKEGKKAADYATDGFKHGVTEAKKVEKIVRKAMGEGSGKKKKSAGGKKGKKDKKDKKDKGEEAGGGVGGVDVAPVSVPPPPAPKRSNLSRME